MAARAPVAGLGAARVADLLVNVQLPVMLLYARVFRDTAVRTGVRALIREMPSRQVNSVVRRIDEHLIAGRFPLSTAFLQQGALQLMRMYCLEHRCGDCEVGRRTGVARA